MRYRFLCRLFLFSPFAALTLVPIVASADSTPTAYQAPASLVDGWSTADAGKTGWNMARRNSTMASRGRPASASTFA